MTTFAEYLTFEQRTDRKYDFYAGEILLRPDRTSTHCALAANLCGALTRTPGCHMFFSDLRIRVLATGRAVHPDLSMVCRPLEYDSDDPDGTTIINPTMLVEIASPENELAARGPKWRDYQLIPSLQEYVLVSTQPRVEIFRRMSSGNWEYLDVREGIVQLACGATLDVTALYDDLPL